MRFNIRKPRYLAAKVAMAATLLWQASEDGEAPPEMEGTAVLDFVEEVRQASLWALLSCHLKV